MVAVYRNKFEKTCDQSTTTSRNRSQDERGGLRIRRRWRRRGLIDIPTEHVTASSAPRWKIDRAHAQSHERHDPTARVEGASSSTATTSMPRAWTWSARARGNGVPEAQPLPQVTGENIARGPKIHGFAEGKDELDAIVEIRRARWAVEVGTASRKRTAPPAASSGCVSPALSRSTPKSSMDDLFGADRSPPRRSRN